MPQLGRSYCNAKDLGRRPAKKSPACIDTSDNNISSTDKTLISNRLNSFLASRPLPGLQIDQSCNRFVDELLRSWEQHASICNLSSYEMEGFADPLKANFNVVLGIL